MLAVPSKDTPPIVLAVSKAVAVAALPVVEPDVPETLPVTLPVTFPSKLATNVPVDIVKLPVEAPVNEPVPTINLSALSSKPINALSELPFLLLNQRHQKVFQMYHLQVLLTCLLFQY